MAEANFLCPGGKHKKIRHCGCRDIASDLEQILRSSIGGQVRAAREQLDRLMATRSNRSCLLALKAGMLLSENKLQELEETVLAWQRVEPDNFKCLQFAAFLQNAKGNVVEAVALLQQSLVGQRDNFDQHTGELFLHVGTALESQGHFAAAAYHMIQASCHGLEEDGSDHFSQILRSGRIPVIFRRWYALFDGPEDADWYEDHHRAVEGFARGRAQAALDVLLALRADYPDEPMIAWNIALTRSCLAQEEAPESWRRAAAMPGMPLINAADAFAFAAVMEDPFAGLKVPLTRQIKEISDANDLIERLLSSDLATVYEGVSELDADEPPPKGEFLLVGPWFDVELAGQEVAAKGRFEFGWLRVFGKQTDRAARLEINTVEISEFDEARVRSAELFDGLVLSEEAKEVLETIDVIRIVAGARLELDDECPKDAWKSNTKHALIAQRLQPILLDLSQELMNGKSLRDVVGQDEFRVPVEGLLELYRLLPNQIGIDVGIDDLRSALQLAPLERSPWDLITESVISNDWYSRHPEEASESQCVRAARNSIMLERRHFAGCAVDELFGRELPMQPESELEFAELKFAAYGTYESRMDAANRAIRILKSRQKPIGAWEVRKLRLALDGGCASLVSELSARVQAHHLQEPGVAEMMRDLFRELGLITEDGRPMTAQGETPDTEAGESEPKIITSTSESEEPPGGESKLWIPGMD